MNDYVICKNPRIWPNLTKGKAYLVLNNDTPGRIPIRQDQFYILNDIGRRELYPSYLFYKSPIEALLGEEG